MEIQNDLILIRHAQSKYNEANQRLRKKQKLPFHWNELKQHPSFNLYLQQVKHNLNLVDTPITQKGLQQCLNGRQHTKHLKPNVILVSPLNRALQTCQILFPNPQVPVIVQPLLSQAIRASCDISAPIEQKINKYKEYNFDQVIKKGDLWFIYNDQLNSQTILNYIQQQKPQTYHQKQKAFSKLMKEKNYYQDPTTVKRRMKKLKQKLKQYKKNYHKIVMVCHYNVIKYICSKTFDQNNQPTQFIHIKNCQIIQKQFAQILQIE